MRSKTLVVVVFVTVVISCSYTPRLLAQAVYGSIFGTVTDPQGAAVAGAKVTVTNQRTRSGYLLGAG